MVDDSSGRWLAVVDGGGRRSEVVVVGGNNGILIFLPKDNILFPWECWIPMRGGGNDFDLIFLLGNAIFLGKFFQTLYQKDS